MGRRSIVGAMAVTLLATAGVLWWRAEDHGPLSAAGAGEMVGDYLDAVEREDYRAAAELVAGGDDRRSVGEIAAGLADHCRDGCLAPTAIAVDGDRDDGGRYVVIVTFGEPRGHPLQRTFAVGESDDGRAYVQGLPPSGTGALSR